MEISYIECHLQDELRKIEMDLSNRGFCRIQSPSAELEPFRYRVTTCTVFTHPEGFRERYSLEIAE